MLNFLAALKFFRMLASLKDTFYQALMTHNDIFGHILDIVCETMPRDNLLNSACLELFECIRRENIKPFVLHIVEKYLDKIENITYVDTFQGLVLRYEQMQGYVGPVDSTLYETPTRIQPNGQRWHGVKEMDAAEEEYFNTSDDDEEVSLLIGILLVANFISGRIMGQLWLHTHRMDLRLRLSSLWWTTQMMTMILRWTQSRKLSRGNKRVRRRSRQLLHPQLRSRRQSDYLKSAAAKRKTKTSWSS